MQDFLTTAIEAIFIYQTIALIISFIYFCHSKASAPQVEAGRNFDEGVKTVMAIEPEIDSTIVKVSNNRAIQTAPVSSLPTLNTVAQIRTYIKEDEQRRARVEAFLNGTKYYRAKKADLLAALESVAV